jgi:hypothetical protein
MTREHIASLLEIASFFLVSLDLYGEDRLERLGQRLSDRKALQASLERKLNWSDYFHPNRFLVMMLILMAIYFILWDIGENRNSWIIVGLKAASVGCFLLTVTIFTFFGLASVAAIIAITLIFAVSFAVNKYRLSGWMMTIGAALFGVSKYLTW